MSLLGPFVKMSRALKERGLKGAINQLYLIGDLKFGDLKGTDKFGNKYFENLDLPYGQHRWVEYKNIHNYDSTMIQPEWHGWMHHVYDETPNDPVAVPDYLPSSTVSHAIYNTHVGRVSSSAAANEREQLDTSQYRRRGYKIGSLMTGPDEEDHYYKQPGHPLSKDSEKGRFN